MLADFWATFEPQLRPKRAEPLALTKPTWKNLNSFSWNSDALDQGAYYGPAFSLFLERFRNERHA